MLEAWNLVLGASLELGAWSLMLQPSFLAGNSSVRQPLSPLITAKNQFSSRNSFKASVVRSSNRSLTAKGSEPTLTSLYKVPEAVANDV